MDVVRRSHRPEIDWLADGPIAPYIDAFKQYLVQRRYAAKTFVTYLHCIAHFARWVRSRRLWLCRRIDEALIVEFLDGHLPECECTGPGRHERGNHAAALGHLLVVLRSEGAIVPPAVSTTPVDEELRRYGEYMEHVRGLAPKTRSMALRIVGRLLTARFGGDPVAIAAIKAEHVRRFFAQQAKLYSKPANAGMVVASLRGYFRCRASLGDLVHGLIGAVSYPANWSLSGLQDAITWRTKTLQSTLAQQGWRGLAIAFDWPSDNSTLNYLEDRSDAAEVANRMVSDAIQLLIDAQRDVEHPCKINVHLLGHSTGAYVIMEAFNQAQKKGALYRAEWRVAQVALIGGDISSTSLRADSEWSSPMFERCVRLTNYSNRHDKVLGVSNAKRLGTSPRVGRVGLPADAHPKAINVDCTRYFASKDPSQSVFNGTFNHSWHIGDKVFALDLAMTLEGEIDRLAVPTREKTTDGLILRPGMRPAFQAAWDVESPNKARGRLTPARGSASPLTFPTG